jgi:hypothetical protein
MFNRKMAIETLLADPEIGLDYNALSDDELIEELEARDISYLFGEIDD